MATTRIIPMHLNKGKTLAQCLADRTEYGMNPDKTEGGTLISTFACEPETAVSEFALSKREYRELTGRVQESDVIAYQVRQSFKPGEVTPEEANRIGYEFAKRFLKGRHAFLVCTHTDKKHIHNHIYWNSTVLDCTRKFKNFIGSYRAVRRLSDLICAEHRLSVVENPQKHGLSYNKWRGGHDKLSNRDLLRMAIDAALEKQPKDFDALLALLKSSGYSVARKGRLSLRHENQKQSIRLESLGEGYSEQELRAVLAGSRTHKPFVRKKYPKRRERATLIADIEAKLNSGKGYRYDQAMKVVKLKQMAKTLIYLEEKGFADFDALADAAADAEKKFYDLKAAIKAAEARMGEIQTLRTHIMNYSRTRSVYTGYRKAGYSKRYLAEHEGDILIADAVEPVGDIHAGVHCADLGDERLGARLFRVALETKEPGKVRKAGIGRRTVILEHEWQEHSVRKAVRYAVEAAERVGDGVHVADARARKGRARVERCLQHRRAVVKGCAVAVRALQVRKNGHDRAFRERAGHAGVVEAAQIRLHRVRQRVHAGLRRDARGKASGQRGV